MSSTRVETITRRGHVMGTPNARIREPWVQPWVPVPDIGHWGPENALLPGDQSSIERVTRG